MQGEIAKLRNEITDAVDDITNSLLGISSVGDAAENLVSTMIDAFRNGEDYMLKFDDTFENMIDNMVMKSIVSKVIGQRIEEMWAQIQSRTDSRGESQKKEIERLTKEYEELQQKQAWLETYKPEDKIKLSKNEVYVVKDMLAQVQNDVSKTKKELEDAQRKYTDAIKPTPQDVETIRDDAENWRDSVKKEFEAYMEAFGIVYGGQGTKTLSALQQGIQNITEETGGAIEAYMNGVSQQVYLQSSLMTEIRDAVIGFDMDVQLGTMAQILLQLQTNYTVMMSMARMMDGWTTPSGQGIRVELIK